LGHAGDGGVAAHDLRETVLGDRTGHAVSRAREADEQHIVVPQAAAGALGMRAEPCLNGRPRKTLGWMTPADKLAALTTPA